MFLTGCSLSPSYTPQQTERMIEQVSREKYHLNVSTALRGQTVYASAQMPGFLQRLVRDGAFSRQDSDTIGNILVATTQISLSTHPPIQFYVLRLSDPDASGAELRYVTYLDDIRRLYANALSEGEFFDRRIQELKANVSETAMSDPWMEREVTLGEFLAVQLALRIKALGLQRSGPADALRGAQPAPDAALAHWQLEDCVGWYRDGVFSLAVVRGVPPGTTTAGTAPWPPAILQLMARILDEYRFAEYHRIVLTDTSTNSTVELSPDDLAAYLAKR